MEQSVLNMLDEKLTCDDYERISQTPSVISQITGVTKRCSAVRLIGTRHESTSSRIASKRLAPK
jgi:hypothetical protein